MSTETRFTAADATQEIDQFAERPSRRRPRRRAVMIPAMVLVAGGATVGILAATGVIPLGSGSHPASGTQDNGAPTSIGTVQLRDLSSQTSDSGTLDFAASYTALNRAPGTYTALPSAGDVIKQGHLLYRVDGYPVVLLYGSTPAYRTLDSNTAKGFDVKELNADLVALGYATTDELNPDSDAFTEATLTAIDKLQASLGVKQNGKLTLGQVVFLPSEARVVSVTPTVGAAAQPGATVFTASSTTRIVDVNLPATQQTYLKVGDDVTIALPDNSTVAGKVTYIGSVAASSGNGSNGNNGSSGSGNGGNGGNNGNSNSSATVPVQIKPSALPQSESTHWDQAPVNVSITTGTARSALVVPVNALVALSSGGYAVEVVESNGSHRLVPVTPGLFDDADALVAVTGAGLSQGMRVVVPSL